MNLQGKSGKMNKLGGIGGIIGLIAIVVGIFFALNYFNVISLSLLYPKYFGLLPHAPISFTPKFVPEKKTLMCPVASDMCNKGFLIVSNKSIPTFYGVGYTNFPQLRKNDFKSVMPGTIAVGATVNKNGEKDTLVTITNKLWGVEADYTFKGDPYPGVIRQGTVKQGDLIGILNNQKLQQGFFDQQYNLIISIVDLKTGKTIKADPTWNQELK